MNRTRQVLTLLLMVFICLNFIPHAIACGPESINPIFVFDESPDLPFVEFTQGKIGIVKPTFGRKTLVIAYRILNGGSFTGEEQQALVEALQGRAPEDNARTAINEWIEVRKEFATEGEKLPEIYANRRNGGYDFFPNCSKNAFEVAKQTLKDRAASYGAGDSGVKSWLAAQDIVFQACESGGVVPAEAGPTDPVWVREDRDYQIAAALFYSLKFEAARERFERIAKDTESPWQSLAEYLIARTLVREASLTKDEKQQLPIYQAAEFQLQKLLAQGGQFSAASQKLLALIKYRIHPRQRVAELAQSLARDSGNENLRQDLTDYVWLLDRLQAKIQKEETLRREALKPEAERKKPLAESQNEATYAARRSGEILVVTYYPLRPDGEPDYTQRGATLEFDHTASADDVLQAFELKLGRKLDPSEKAGLLERRLQALEYRAFAISPNRKWDENNRAGWEGYCYECDEFRLNLLPEYLVADDLTDWIFTFQASGPEAFSHAFSKWRETRSSSWLVAALAASDARSTGINRLLRAAELVSHESNAFPSVAYHLIRIKLALGQKMEARKLLDEVINGVAHALPTSAVNQFLEQRLMLADNMSEFLKFALRRPVAFYEYGIFGRIADIFAIEKNGWSGEYSNKNKEEFEQELEESYRDLLPWDDRVLFDQRTLDILNWHFPLRVLEKAALDTGLPEYLRNQLIEAAWTRAVLLENDLIARRLAKELARTRPEMRELLKDYQNAETLIEREQQALYILLKSPGLAPFVAGGIPTLSTPEQLDYYFETAWWCAPENTEYDNAGNKVAKIVPQPQFMTPSELDSARAERKALIDLGDAKSYLGRRVLSWARKSPDDPRIPEALYIAAAANRQYKYGCQGWEYDEKTKNALEELLRTRYPRSPWAEKLSAPNN
jgi:hypothetical protein